MQPRFGSVVEKNDTKSEKYANAALVSGVATVPAVAAAVRGARMESRGKRAKAAAERSFNRNNAAAGRIEYAAGGVRGKMKGRDNRRFDGGKERNARLAARDAAARRIEGYKKIVSTGRKMKLAGGAAAGVTGAVAAGSLVAAERSRKNTPSRAQKHLAALRQAEARRNGLA